MRSWLKLKWLPILICAVLGSGVLFLLAFFAYPAISDYIYNYGYGASVYYYRPGYLFATISLGITSIVYLAVGLGAGLWSGFRGAQHGVLAAFILWVGATASYFSVIATQGSLHFAPHAMSIVVPLVFALPLGTVGGFIGAHARSTKLAVSLSSGSAGEATPSREAKPLPESSGHICKDVVCPVCGHGFASGQIARVCRYCRAKYHKECLQKVGGCTTHGCKNAAKR